MSVFDDFWSMLTGLFSDASRRGGIIDSLNHAADQEGLDAVWNGLSEKDRADVTFKQIYDIRSSANSTMKTGQNPLTTLVSGMLDSWVETVHKYDMSDPAKAKENLAGLSADVLTLSASALAVELALGALPNGEGTVASTKVSTLMAWLGVGAVVTAVAHDPVKIGLLRPYQDSLEATFRNRRPDDFALFQAYRTRELSPVKIEDLSKLTDAEMNRIEVDNDTYYSREIAKWGYSEWFATALARSATRTLNFSQLVTLARAGIYDKGLCIYSLWGEGLDRVVMPAALTAIETLRDREMYSGFRSMIEPSYVEGDLSEADLIAYWSLAGVPQLVQDWVLPRLRKRREAYVLKQKTSAAVKERDLTVSQIQQAYQNLLMERAIAQNMILAMGYSLDEARILLDLAELRRKLPAAATLKRLPLSDYEKAYKTKIITLQEVLNRMQGEYAPGDIAIEKVLLETGKA